MDKNGSCTVVRKDPKNDADYKKFGFINPSPVPLDSESHGGDDVGIYAIGPYSHLFKSVHEQSYIAYVMSYSACIGPYKDDSHCLISSSASALMSNFLLFSILQLLFFSRSLLRKVWYFYWLILWIIKNIESHFKHIHQYCQRKIIPNLNTNYIQ